MCSGSEAGSYVRLIDFVYHSTLGSIINPNPGHVRIQRALGVLASAQTSTPKTHIINPTRRIPQVISVFEELSVFLQPQNPKLQTPKPTS